jgi:hypothetical protein
MTVQTPITGHCLCGAVSYEIDAEPMMAIMCHCEDCRRGSGASYSVNAVFPQAAVKVDESKLKTFETIGEDTQMKRERKFCPECGSPVITLLAEMPEMVVIKAGTLDDPSWFEPQMEIYCGSAHKYVHNAEAPERGMFPRSFATA